MKTMMNEKPTLNDLNKKSYAQGFTHRFLRVKIIVDKYYNPKKHNKGKMYFEKNTTLYGVEQILLMGASDNQGGYCPMLEVNKN